MAAKRKANLKTILLMCVAFVLIAAVAGVIYLSVSAPKNDLTDLPEDSEVMLPESGNQEKPDETNEEEQVQVDLVDYTVYDLDQVDFRFIIAKVRVKANDATNISLSHFKTSEGLVLSETSAYVNQLEKNSLYLGKKNVWFELISSQTNYLARIFIPVKDNTLSSISLESDLKNSHVMKFDLENPRGTAEELGYVADDIISDGKTYQMKVSNAYRISDEFTRTYESGYTEAYLLPSSAEVHGFYVEAVSLWGDAVEIESAYYQVQGSSEQFEALNGQFTTQKYDNIVNSSITDKDAGYIFFVTLNPEDAPISYQGTLILHLKNQQQPIQIQVNLH
ncbi:MAG: hypothetical protein E7192_07165 [Erysipelotrichaceae bacterium]|nr:hypothetical protein [Erysipelotrichaceae bacterium]